MADIQNIEELKYIFKPFYWGDYKAGDLLTNENVSRHFIVTGEQDMPLLDIETGHILHLIDASNLKLSKSTKMLTICNR